MKHLTTTIALSTILLFALAAPLAQAVSANNLIGTWSFNSNGTVGAMTIFRARSNLLTGTATLEVSVSFPSISRQDKWTGIWSISTKVITLTRTMQVANTVTQTYTGFMGDNDPPRLLFGGFFTQSDVPATAPRTKFGWSANWQSPLP